MTFKEISLATIAIIIIGGFSFIGIRDATKRKEELKIQEIEIKTKATEFEELDSILQKKTKDLTEAEDKTNQNQQQIEQLRLEKEAIEKEKEQLKVQLQAKLEEKDRLAKASTDTINKATGTLDTSASSTDSSSIRATITQASSKYGVSESMMLRLAQCESTMGANLRNPNPVIVKGKNYGHAEGVFQFIPSTWTRMSSQAGYSGASVYNTNANINVAAWAFANGNKGEWECR